MTEGEHGECQKLDPEVGHEDEGYSCTTHNMPWGECPPPSIPEAWDLITAGDGRMWERVEDRNTTYRWAEFGANEEIRSLYTDAQILALGPVRRCAPVTLPDDSDYPGPSEFISMREDAREYADVYGPEAAEEYAAELLAAALHAEGAR